MLLLLTQSTQPLSKYLSIDSLNSLQLHSITLTNPIGDKVTLTSSTILLIQSLCACVRLAVAAAVASPPPCV